MKENSKKVSSNNKVNKKTIKTWEMWIILKNVKLPITAAITIITIIMLTKGNIMIYLKNNKSMTKLRQALISIIQI